MQADKGIQQLLQSDHGGFHVEGRSKDGYADDRLLEPLWEVIQIIASSSHLLRSHVGDELLESTDKLKCLLKRQMHLKKALRQLRQLMLMHKTNDPFDSFDFLENLSEMQYSSHVLGERTPRRIVFQFGKLTTAVHAFWSRFQVADSLVPGLDQLAALDTEKAAPGKNIENFPYYALHAKAGMKAVPTMLEIGYAMAGTSHAYQVYRTPVPFVVLDCYMCLVYTLSA